MVDTEIIKVVKLVLNSKVLKTLEYQKIKNELAQYLVTQRGTEILAELIPASNEAVIQNQLLETRDGATLLRLKDGIPLAKLFSIKPQLKRLEIGASLSAKELADICRLLASSNQVKRFFLKLADEKIALQCVDTLAEDINILPEISRRLLESIEFDGYITDLASVTLRNLRRQITTTEAQLREQLNQLTKGQDARYLSDAVITIRNDRYVIPVKAEYRKHFGGIVHDQSSSGQTLFIEPKAMVELNNRLKQYQAAQKEEISRILKEFSEQLMPYTKELALNEQILGQLDFINAKAKYAKQLDATEPLLSSENELYLRQVWHPLLDPKKAVKNDLLLGKDYQAIVITGPNTGGKTITLKTLGLVQLMGQSGLFIPAREESTIGIFTEIFADIGDEQSIEQNLSTFSSHMTNIVEILAKADQKSLVLFDELGAGTDPQEGSALAIAILDHLGVIGSYVVATTHYPELKVYGYQRAKTINASMEFDSQTLKPTYHLLLGIPGRSNAFDISKRLGLDVQIVNNARQFVTKESQELNEMIADLVQKRQEAKEEAISLQKYLAQATKLHADLTEQYQALVDERAKLLQQAKMKANQITEQTRQEAEALISELRKLKLNAASEIKENELIEAKARLNALEQPLNLQKNKVLQRAKKQQSLQPNDDVLVKSYGQRGVLLKKSGQDAWEVQIGILKMKIAEADLEKITLEEPKTKRAHTTVRSARSSHVSPTLDLRGQRYEEALTEVDRYLDAAILAGYPHVTIVHGKGTGALRQGITKYLQQHRSVKKFEFAPPNAGGNGATVVYFK